MVAETIDDSINRFNSIVSRFLTFFVSRYVVLYYVINKKLKVLILMPEQLSVFMLKLGQKIKIDICLSSSANFFQTLFQTLFETRA
jgi:hypothetical protein